MNVVDFHKGIKEGGELGNAAIQLDTKVYQTVADQIPDSDISFQGHVVLDEDNKNQIALHHALILTTPFGQNMIALDIVELEADVRVADDGEVFIHSVEDVDLKGLIVESSEKLACTKTLQNLNKIVDLTKEIWSNQTK